MSTKDADCELVVQIMSRAYQSGAAFSPNDL